MMLLGTATNIAREWYESTRKQIQFNIVGFSKRLRNQFATTYYFSDGSRLIINDKRKTIAYGDKDWCLASRWWGYLSGNQ